MIFVTVGTNEARFDRLLRALANLQLDEELIVQHGHSSPIEIPGARNVDFLPFDAMTETMRRARVVVTHAGVGSVMVALGNGKRPVVVPRRKEFGEAVDDHQLQLGRRFAEAGLVTFVDAPEDLADALDREQEAARVVPASSSLAADLRQYLAVSIGLATPVRA
jgi:exopolysaccharide biosynthesis glucuronosyltransferase PssE